MLSNASKYSIVVLQYLSDCDPDEYHSVSIIADSTNTPAAYLSKLTKELTWAGVLESKRGVGGGVRLTEKGRTLSLFALCDIMHDPVVKQDCVLRNQPCDPDQPCSFHAEYADTRKRLVEFLQNGKIHDSIVKAPMSDRD